MNMFASKKTRERRMNRQLPASPTTDDSDLAHTAAPPAIGNFTEETEELQRTNRINLYPYCLRQDEKMQMSYSPVKYLRAQASHHKHAEELAAQGIIENQKLSFTLPVKTPIQLKLEEEAEEVKKLEKQIQRLKDEEARWIEGMKEDAEDEARRVEAEAAKNKRKSTIVTKKRRPLPANSPPKFQVMNSESNDLDSTTNMVDCPQCCGKMIRTQDIASHAKVCTSREITCPEVGCNDRILFCDIKSHKGTTCRIAIRRQKLLDQKKARDEEVKELLLEKAASPARKVKTAVELLVEQIDAERVQNARLRWLQSAELNLMRANDSRTNKRKLEAELFDIFDIDPDIAERAKNARKRHQEVPCPNCGEFIVQMFLNKHINTVCVNRKVPCRNWELGCPAMIRLRDRATHENVEHLLKPRPCIRWTGNAGFVELGEEEDIKPPWTAEFWVYRSSARECAMNTTRKALEAGEKKEELAEVAQESMKMLLKGEQMLAELAQRVAKKRSPELMREKERVTEQLIDMAKDNEAKIRAAAYKKIEYRMLVKASSKCLIEYDKEEGSELDKLVVNLVLDAHLPNTPPATAASSNRPFTVGNKMDPPPPIEWHGNGRSLMQHIHAEALLVNVNEKMEEDEIASSAEAKAAARKAEQAAKEKAQKGNKKGKGRRGKADKADRKERRKKHREEVHGVRLEEQIRLETIGTGGVDLLASSARSKLGLNHTKEGKLGFSVAGKGEFTVNTRVPRGEWVHIAYVAFKPPKKRVAIYMNGRLIGYEDGVKCNLPMDKIGSDSHCVQGFVQEVRYWATQRSKVEIKKYMHELLPENATEEGLLGWWTFEEGEGRFAFDVSDQRYQSKIAGRGIRWVTADDLNAPAPTPAWRERACCKVEIRRAKLAKSGRAQLAPCGCPYGCGAPLLKKDVKFHTTYMCPEVVEEPPDWLHGIARKKRAELAEQGLKQMEEVECPSGCDMILKRKDVKKHLKDDCDYRMKQCSNPGCNTFVPLIRLKAHEQFFCESDYAVKKKEMVQKVREKYGYPTPWRLWDIQRNLEKVEEKKVEVQEMKEIAGGLKESMVVEVVDNVNVFN
ncbi:hypothetical protein TL16_g02140 [Triparma laevis f. inornata]|uniref:TRAF-type domain-containing protein n=1 Tax=Triparma laevis f. inornata TaxID=1714386 RepID=A0A9W7DW82_9STRA|nr:hypothetical protein TL16_g02140 [Triparma laevis f. inornata]